MSVDDFQYMIRPLSECFNLAGRELISLVGGGGKTSLMNALAYELAMSGQRVISTTTTRILSTEERTVIESDPDRLIEGLSNQITPGEKIVIASAIEKMEGNSKLVGLTKETINRLYDDQLAEYIIVEADGSKRRPLKAPRNHEPVIPELTTILIGLIGLSSIGKPVDERYVFGIQEFIKITGSKIGDKVNSDHILRLVTHPDGLFKSAPGGCLPILFLNQSDLPEARKYGLEIIKKLSTLKLNLRIVMGSMTEGYREIFELCE